MSSINSPPVTRVDEAWGLIAERITADEKLCKAVAFLLGWQQDRVDVRHLPGVPSDIAYPEIANRIGEVEGLLVAIRSLTDAHYIADEREKLVAKEIKKDV